MSRSFVAMAREHIKTCKLCLEAQSRLGNAQESNIQFSTFRPIQGTQLREAVDPATAEFVTRYGDVPDRALTGDAVSEFRGQYREAAPESGHAPVTRKAARATLVKRREGTAIVPAPGMRTPDEPRRDRDPVDARVHAGDEQVAKSEVNYRYAGAALAEGRACANCRHFIKPGGCALVAGLIRPVDLCDKYEKGETSMDEKKSNAIEVFKEAYTKPSPSQAMRAISDRKKQATSSSGDAAEEFRRERR